MGIEQKKWECDEEGEGGDVLSIFKKNTTNEPSVMQSV